jgi:hypothetical protein
MIAKSEQSEQSRKSAIQTMGGALTALQLVHPIDIAALPPGVYTIKVLCNGQQCTTRKLVKQ